MKTVILACNTIRGELEQAARRTSCRYDFVWVESGLHLVPASLRKRIQEELDRLQGVDRVLLGFGFCGHAVADLESRQFELIVPRADDCITLLLGSAESRKRCSEEGGVYFLTKGWLEGEANIWREYRSTVGRYGQQRADRIYERLLSHYKFLGLIDTGAYELAALLPEVQRIAAALKLEPRVFGASTEYLDRFLTGPWNEDDFVVLPPNTRIEFSHLGLGSAASPPPIPGTL